MYYNISLLGNIEELDRIASDVASLLTLYYKEQIQSIDTDISKKIKANNIFDNAVRLLQDVVYSRPEEKQEIPVIIVADYITGWIIETLVKSRKELKLTEPFPQQLWLSVASRDCVNPKEEVKNKSLIKCGELKIPIKIKKDDGEESSENIQLRYLIGCVSVVTKIDIFQYQVPKESRDKELKDLEWFGYVYTTPFLDDEMSINTIIKGRKLERACRDDANNIVTKLKDIEEYVKTLRPQDNETRQLIVREETARQIAQALREQKTFVDENSVQKSLKDSQTQNQIHIDGLIKDINEKKTKFDASIDATRDKLKEDFEGAQKALKKDNKEHCDSSLKLLKEKSAEIKSDLEKTVTQRLTKIKTQLKQECDEMRRIVEKSEENSNQALVQANKAAQASKQSAQESEQAKEHAKTLVESTEQRRQEFQIVMDRCEDNVKTAITEQKQSCEQSILTLSTQAQEKFGKVKQFAEQIGKKAEESEQAAASSARLAEETQKDTRRQLELQKEETDRVISETKETTRQSELSANEAKEAKKQSKQAADTAATALKETVNMGKTLEKELQQVEKLSKTLEKKQERTENLRKALEKAQERTENLRKALEKA